MTSFFFLLHPRIVCCLCGFVCRPSLLGCIQASSHFPSCSCLCSWCQGSVGGLLSSLSAPVPISERETPPTQPLCWWLAALGDLIAGKAAAWWYVVSRHHLLELLGGRKLWCWKFLTAVFKGWKWLIRGLTDRTGHPSLPQCSSQGQTLSIHKCLLN